MLVSSWPDFDTVLEVSPLSIVVSRGTAIGEDFYEHHFSGMPVVPAVLMLSWLEHAGGVLVARQTSGRFSAVLREMQRVSCLRVATPGDSLNIYLNLQSQTNWSEISAGTALEAKGLLKRDGSSIMRAHITLEVVTYGDFLPPWKKLGAQVGLNTSEV